MPSPTEKKVKRVEIHAHISDATSTPEHTYVEKIHTPRRSSAVKNGATEVEWAELKHAHIDDDAVSPAGFVERVQTPIATPSERGFSSAVEEIVDREIADEEARLRSESQRRAVQSSVAFALGMVLGGAAVWLLVRRSK